jgi:hypothetical protein
MKSSMNRVGMSFGGAGGEASQGVTSGRVQVAFVVAWFVAAASALACSTSGGAAQSTPSTDAGAGPYLTELSVAASADPSLTLVPPFLPNIHDYYVQCAAGTNSVTVSMTASPGAESRLLQPSQSHASPKQSLALAVSENQAIVASATRGTASTEYWVRCLPHNFQPTRMTKHPDAGAATPGYYLVGAESAPVSGAPPYAMVVDSNGVPVWYYRQPQTLPFETSTGVFDVDTTVDGAISFIPWHSAGFLSPFEIHQLSPLKTTSVTAKGVALDPHELRPLSNGNFLLFTDAIQGGIDLTGFGIKGPDGGTFGPNSDILPCNILEVDREGDLVWKWVGTDHFDAVKDSTLPELGKGPGNIYAADPFHCNAIDVEPSTGNLLVSARNMDSIFYIERSSGKVLWKMGGATYTKDKATYVPVADPFFRQHDARLQPGWSEACGGKGQISLFDDHSAPVRTIQSPPSRAVVYDVNVGAGGGSCGSAGATVAWQRAGSISSWLMGSFRILKDGSRIIGWGYGGQAALVFTEVDADGNDLLDFYFTDGSWSYRSIKVPLAAFDLDTLRRTAGQSEGLPNDAGSDADAGGVDDGSSGSDDATTKDASGLGEDGRSPEDAGSGDAASGDDGSGG